MSYLVSSFGKTRHSKLQISTLYMKELTAQRCTVHNGGQKSRLTTNEPRSIRTVATTVSRSHQHATVTLVHRIFIVNTYSQYLDAVGSFDSHLACELL